MQRINNDIKQNNFKQIYLLSGEERYLKKQYTDRLHKAMCNEGDSMNTHFYEGKDISVGEIIDLAETLPFLSERRVIFISNSNLFKSGGEQAVTEEELLIDTLPLEGYETQADRGVTVTLDTRLTEALIEEGFVRELISKIQSMRKEAGFEVMDRITVSCEGNETIAALMEQNRDTILHDVMGAELFTEQAAGFTMEWDINGEKVTLGVQKIAR